MRKPEVGARVQIVDNEWSRKKALAGHKGKILAVDEAATPTEVEVQLDGGVRVTVPAVALIKSSVQTGKRPSGEGDIPSNLET